MNTGLLTCSDTDSLTVLNVANTVGLGVLQGDKGNYQVALFVLGNILIVGNDTVKQTVGNVQLVSSLLERHAVDLLPLDLRRCVAVVDPDNVVSTLSLAFENFQSLRFIAGSDNAVRYLALYHLSGGYVAYVRKSDKVTVGGHSVRASRSCISAGKGGKLAQIVHPVYLFQRVGKRKSHSRTRRGNVLKGSRRAKSRSLFKLLNKLPAVESVQQVDVAGLSVQHLDRQVCTILHKNSGRLLVGVAAVFQLHFVHF